MSARASARLLVPTLDAKSVKQGISKRALARALTLLNSPRLYRNMFTDCDVDKILARLCLARRRNVVSHGIVFTIS